MSDQQPNENATYDPNENLDTIIDITVPTYNTWKEPKAYFPYGDSLKSILVQRFGPVLGAFVFFICLEKGNIVNLMNSKLANKIFNKGKVTVLPEEVIVQIEDKGDKTVSQSKNKGSKKRVGAYVNGVYREWEYTEKPKSVGHGKFRSFVSDGKRGVYAVWKSAGQGAKWLQDRLRSLVFGGLTKTAKSKPGRGVVGLCISALSYIDALAGLINEVSTGSPTLIWRGTEDVKLALNTKDHAAEASYHAKISVANLAILAHYAYTGAIGGDIGYSLTQLWNTIGTDITLRPEMILDIVVLEPKKKTYKSDDDLEKACLKLHNKWVNINADAVATAATFGNISGFVPILTAMFAGKLGSSGKTISAVFVMLISNALDDVINSFSSSLEALTNDVE